MVVMVSCRDGLMSLDVFVVVVVMVMVSCRDGFILMSLW